MARTPDDDLFHKRPQHPGYCPRIRSGFHRQAIFTSELSLGKSLQTLSCYGNGVGSEQRAIRMQDGEDRRSLVDITTDEA